MAVLTIREKRVFPLKGHRPQALAVGKQSVLQGLHVRAQRRVGYGGAAVKGIAARRLRLFQKGHIRQGLAAPESTVADFQTLAGKFHRLQLFTVFKGPVADDAPIARQPDPLHTGLGKGTGFDFQPGSPAGTGIDFSVEEGSLSDGMDILRKYRIRVSVIPLQYAPRKHSFLIFHVF